MAQWEYSSFLFGLARVSATIALFDAPLGAVCAFHAATVMGYGLWRRDSHITMDRVVMGLVVGLALCIWSALIAATSGWIHAISLSFVQLVSVGCYWLYLREHEHSPWGATVWGADFYTSVGSLPVIVGLFWWFGENQALDMTTVGVRNSTLSTAAGGLSITPPHLETSHILILVWVCVADHARRFLATQIRANSSSRYLAAVELVTMFLILACGSFFSETPSLISTVLFMGASLFSYLFVKGGRTEK
jgi:hypothetical protein